MYIQIDNAGFYNKGAELMLQAVIQRLSQETTLQPKFVAGTGCTAPDNLQIRKAGLYQIPKFFRFHYRLDKLLPQFALDPYGLAKEESVNAIIDAGGFQFGDQWSYGYSKETNKALSQYYRRYKNQGAKIIFLPQAFGPFTNPLARERVKLVFDYADIIYAREKVSYQYLMEIFGENEKIKLAPDFTNLVEPLANHSLLKQIRGGVCLIPNARMTDKTDEVETDRVVTDDFEGARLATTHLIECGCRNILHLATTENLLIGKNRYLGYLQALENHNIPFNEEYVIKCDTREEVYAKRKQILALAPKIDGVFAVNDSTAISAMQVLQENGYHIPGDISVVGFGDGPIATIASPPLTTVEQKGYEIGREAVRMLIQRLESPNAQVDFQTRIVPPSLVKRKSTK
jgi:hypothetical protein